MRTAQELEREFEYLNSIRLDLTDIQVDFNAGLVKCVFGYPDDQNIELLFRDIIDLHYAPDYADEPPWIFGDVKLETLSQVNDLKTGEGLWVHQESFLKKYFPCYRVSFESGDFRLSIICRSIDVLTS